MCGIAGFYGAGDNATLKRMTDAIRARGPDDEGHFVDGNVGLGMRRLSIIDLAGGHQPIFNEDGTIVIVFNGEIYNFPSLRASLEQEGHRFKTNSDTEAIVHAYEQWGDECVNHLRGMFAFAIWDVPRKRLLLARDRLGIKPLHYALTPQGLVFGSEIKSILEHPDIERVLDPEALHDYLSFLYVPAPKTIFQGIRKLPPGHTMAYEGGAVQVRRYWDLRFSETPINSLDEAVRTTRPILDEAIRIHMLSDVPMGVYLSGGIDSSAIAALMATHTREPIRTFTVGFRDEGFSEAKYARMVAEHIGADHREVTLEADAFKMLPEIVRQHDEPFGNSTSTIHYLISREIARDVKVAMSGAGGDEVFTGYPKYVAMRYAERYRRLPRFLTRSFIEAPLKLLPEGNRERDYVRWARSFTRAAALPPADRYHALTTYMTEEEKRDLYTERLDAMVGTHDSRALTRSTFAASGTGDVEQQTLYAEMQGFLAENILTYGDRTSMGASLEARVPLLDHVLVEHAASISPQVRMPGTHMKAVLKGCVKDMLPKQILTRRKMGFNPPTALWLDQDGAWMVERYLEKGLLARQGLFDATEVARLLDEQRRKARNNGLRLWALIMFEAWHELYIERQAR